MDVCFLFDYVSLGFVYVVLLVRGTVMCYSFFYMGAERKAFIYLVVFFVSSMVLLVLSSSLLRLMFGWELLGAVSFCLIVYYQNRGRLNSGLITIYINRLGDISIVFSLFFVFRVGS